MKRRFPTRYGVAFSTETKDTDAIVDRGGRHLFTVPWRNYTLVGVWHVVFHGPPEDITVSESELQLFADEVRKGFPGLKFSLDDIQMVNTGLTLYGDEAKQDVQHMSFGKRSMLVDHRKEHGVEGLVTLIGVRATTARGMSEKALNIIAAKLNKNTSKCLTETTPVFGGDMDSFDTFLGRSVQEMAPKLNTAQVTGLVHNYGTHCGQVLKYAETRPELLLPLGDSTVLRTEVIHAVREEMAQRLADVVFRRTDLGTGGDLNAETLALCAELMAQEMNWTSHQRQTELEHVKRDLLKHRPQKTL
jgi:glycerol-3-phosphate dehydrogenase